MLFRSHNPDYKDGGQMRDFIWVDDCVEIMVWLMENPAASGLFNVGTGKARRFGDLAKAVFKELNQQPEIRYVDTPLPIRDKYQYFTEAKITRLRHAGYSKPFTGLEQGVARYVQDFLLKDDPYL